MVSLCNCMNSTGTAPPVQSIVFSYRYCPACPVGHDLNYIFNLIAYRNRGVFRGGPMGSGFRLFWHLIIKRRVAIVIPLSVSFSISLVSIYLYISISLYLCQDGNSKLFMSNSKYYLNWIIQNKYWEHKVSVIVNIF